MSVSSDDVVIVERLCKVYRMRNLERQVLVENMQRRMLGIDPRSQTIHALDRISFRVARGESVGIVGQNGSGKSTLLKILARIASPTSGNGGVRARIAAQLQLGSRFQSFSDPARTSSSKARY